jgi:CO/xanthine dehydrogenase Mo-binding subunit
MTRKRLGQHVRGQSMVEAALILPVFLLVLVGIFDVGRLVYAYHTVNNAAREGGRQAIVDQTSPHIQARAAQHSVALGVEALDVVVDFRDADTPDTADSCLTEDGDPALGTDSIYGCLAVVVVPYQYTAATPLIGNLIGTMQVTGEVRFPVEFNCVEPDKPQCPVGE